MVTIRARVPSRIDFLGGGSDAPPFSTEFGGAVLNAGITRYAQCTLELGGDLSGVEIRSLDMGASERADSLDALELRGPLALLKAAVRRAGLQGPWRMTTEADLPPQSGLGASASITVAVLAACHHALGQPIDPLRIVEESFAAERLDVGLPGGKQDECAAAFGGIHLFEFKDPHVGVRALKIDPAVTLELEQRLLLAYTGQVHLSNNIHADIKAAYADPQGATRRAMHELTRLAYEGAEALERGELTRFASLLTENWRYHQDLHASCGNDRLAELYALAARHGVLGGKTCGAGGGGCVVFCCAEGGRRPLAEALRAAGCEILHFTFDQSGIQVWRVPEE